MARASNKLSAVEVKGIDKKGMYHDGGGLYLQVSAGGVQHRLRRPVQCRARLREDMNLSLLATTPTDISYKDAKAP